MQLERPQLIVLDDYEGQLAASPAMARLRQLAEVTILDRPLSPADWQELKNFQVVVALRERTRLDERFFAACPNLELVLQTGGHAYHGAIVDEDALIEALHEKRIAGAGLDVFAVEPLPAASPLRMLPNVLLTPHTGWQVSEVLHEFAAIAAEQLTDWRNGQLATREILNPEAASVARQRRGGVASASNKT